MGQGPGTPLRDMSRNKIFELFCRYWNPHQVGEVTVCGPRALGPQTSQNQKVDDVDSRLPQHQPFRRVSISWSHPWTIPVKLFPALFKSGHTVLGGMSLLWPPLPGKAIKLFISASPKSLSLGDLIQCQGTEARFSFSTKIETHVFSFCRSVPCLGGFPGGSAGKEPACNAEDPGLIPG